MNIFVPAVTIAICGLVCPPPQLSSDDWLQLHAVPGQLHRGSLILYHPLLVLQLHYQLLFQVDLYNYLISSVLVLK